MLLLLLHLIKMVNAQTVSDSIKDDHRTANADDPSQFFTRIEIFNEIQHYKNDTYLDISTIRTIVKVGKRFTTRLDVPLIYNSTFSSAGYKQFGMGDISLRLLGYRFLETKNSAVTTSIEVSLNTAQSPLLGTGKNTITPLLTYTRRLKEKRMIFSLLFQQTNSFSGDKDRTTISFSKLQAVLIKYWSKRMWTVLSPELYIDYVDGGASMNLETRATYAPLPRLNLWVQAGVGIFGDYIARYQWSGELGCRYFVMRKMNFKARNDGL